MGDTYLQGATNALPPNETLVHNLTSWYNITSYCTSGRQYFYEPKVSENAAHECNNHNMHVNKAIPNWFYVSQIRPGLLFIFKNWKKKTMQKMQSICTCNPASFSGLCTFVASSKATNTWRPGNEAKHSPHGKIGGWRAVLCRWAVLN